MKKVFLLAYAKVNLGDDIFLTMLCKKYPEVQFYINIPEMGDRAAFHNLDNLFFIENVKDRKDYDSIKVEEYDALGYIGGSVFMENAWGLEDNTNINRLVLRCKKLNKPFFYISSNFGPCKTKEYFEVSHSIISNCQDVCFRDRYSYDLFSELPSVRYEPDLILGYDVGEFECEKDVVGISVIGFDIRDELVEFETKYYDLLENSVRMYIQEGKKVVFFSFCKYECDEIGIDKLLERFSADELNHIKVVKYDGDIEGFIEEYKKPEYMICTRFHSMILSVVCHQKVYCVSYSQKMNRVVDDLNFGIALKNINELTDNEKIELDGFRSVADEIVEDCAKRSQQQFQGIENFLKVLA